MPVRFISPFIRLAVLNNCSDVYLFKSRRSLSFRLPTVFHRKYSSETTDNNGCNTEICRVADIISSGDITKVVVLAGAGISTASGIPDFRSPGSGLYDNLAKYNLPWPEAVFDLEYFYTNPAPFYALAKELYPTGRYRPNIAHYFMRLLHEKSRLLRVYTQNIDSLERLAGVPSEKLVEAHGSFLTATCIVCKAKAPPGLVELAIEQSFVPKCPKCGEVIKPDIVFFGESLPERFWSYERDLAQTDLVLIMGTSLEVYPFANVVDDVPTSVPRVLLNRDAVGSFRGRKRPNDFVILGSITDSITCLARSLDWYNALNDLINRSEPNPPANRTGNKGPHSARQKPNQRSYSTSVSSESVDQVCAQFRSLSVTHQSKPARTNNQRKQQSAQCASPVLKTSKKTGKSKASGQAKGSTSKIAEPYSAHALHEYLYPDPTSQSDLESSTSSPISSSSSEATEQSR